MSQIVKVFKHCSSEFHVLISIEGNISSHLLYDVWEVLIKSFDVFTIKISTFEFLGVYFDCDCSLKTG